MAEMNLFRTFALLALLSGLIVLAGYLLVGNETGLYYGLGFAAVGSFGSWYSLTRQHWPHLRLSQHPAKRLPSCTRG